MSHGKRKLKSNVNSMSLFQKDAHIHTTSLRTTRGREGGAGAGRFCRPRGQTPGWAQRAWGAREWGGADQRRQLSPQIWQRAREEGWMAADQGVFALCRFVLLCAVFGFEGDLSV